MTASAPFAPELVLVPSALLVNTVLTFWGTLGFALLAARWAPFSAMKKWVLLLPFARLAYDLCSGVPDGAYVLSSFAGTRWELGRFALGFGWTRWQVLPTLELRLGALKADHWYPLSAGDICAHALFYRGAGWFCAGVSSIVVLIASYRVLRRLSSWYRFTRDLSDAAASESSNGIRLGRIRLRRSARAQKGAFISGVLRPVIWLPRRSEGLGKAQLSAIVRHEIAHVRQGDVVLFAVVGLLSDLLFFMPGVRLLERRIHEAAERAADVWAVRHGAPPIALARALVATAEHRAQGLGSLGIQATGGASIVRRVHALLSPAPAVRGWRLALGTLVTAGSVISAMRSCFFGYG